MTEWVKRFFLRVNWRLSVATAGYMFALYGPETMSQEARDALSATCITVIVASIASWQSKIGRRVLRPEREDGAHEED